MCWEGQLKKNCLESLGKYTRRKSKDGGDDSVWLHSATVHFIEITCRSDNENRNKRRSWSLKCLMGKGKKE